MPKRIDRTGMRYGRLTVLSMHSTKPKTSWNCQCDCGNTVVAVGSNLVTGNTSSCGCLHKEVMKNTMTTHGDSSNPLHGIWVGMMSRCSNPANTSFHKYGGRGIAVHKWFHDFLVFRDYVDVRLGERPSAGHSLDRVDNDKGYEPGNLRWATAKEQGRNTRRNRLITVGGVTKSVAEAADDAGIPYGTVIARLQRGWSDEASVGLVASR